MAFGLRKREKDEESSADKAGSSSKANDFIRPIGGQRSVAVGIGVGVSGGPCNVRERVREGESIPTRARSSAQEQAVAKAVGGVRTPNSGATPWIKGDVLTEDWLIECKTKMQHSQTITLRKDWFDKNKSEMVFLGKKHQALAFNFGPGEENHYVIDEYLFIELQSYLQSKGD